MKHIAISLISILLCNNLLFAGYKAEFFLAGLSYFTSIFMAVQADNKQQEYIESRAMYNSNTEKSTDFKQLADVWSGMAERELKKNGKTRTYEYYLSEVKNDKYNSEKFKLAALDYAKSQDSADEEKNAWILRSYVAAGVGTVFLIKGIFSYVNHNKKKNSKFELKPYNEMMGLKLAYAF